MVEKQKCCGCGVCSIVCPKHCIEMREDEYGFVSPEIDSHRCVSCNLCQAVCPMKEHMVSNETEREAFAAYAQNPDQRFQGSSGGVFGVIALQVIQSGGIVFGASFHQDLKLSMTSAETVEELKKLYKSKYLQSDCRNSYPKIEAALNTGRQVLVCATPCQIAAVKGYLKKEYRNLITVDFFCHGVPSQRFFDRCKAWVEEKQGIRILDYEFRTKIPHGATPHYYTVTYQKGNKITKKTRLYLFSPFYAAFQKYITLRDSCYQCSFATGVRCSDITIGDFHGIDKYVQGINRFDGVSTIVLNTELGKRTFRQIQGKLHCIEMDYSALVKNGELFAGSTAMPCNRDQFLAELKAAPLDQVLYKYIFTPDRWFKVLYYLSPTPLRRVLKKKLVKD